MDTTYTFKQFSLSFEKPLIMGILNVTPDSFSDGGDFFNIKTAISKAQEMEAAGADIIDIGGESSRPGAEPVSAEQEWLRVKDVLTGVVAKVKIPVSIDSYKPEVVAKALEAGASMVNDISGLRDPKMCEVAAEFKVPAIIMHMQGEPRNMQKEPYYNDVMAEIKEFFKQQIALAHKAGIDQVILDPGIGFGKTLEHNLAILRHLGEFKALGYPLLIGTSRKSFIAKISGIEDPKERVVGTIVSNLIAVQNGANILRVHDVEECRRMLEVYQSLVDSRESRVV